MKIERYNSPVIEIKYGKNSNHVIKAHTHKETTIGFVLNGETTVSIDGNMILVTKGTMILIPKGSVHLCSPKDVKNFEYMIIHIDDNWLLNELGIDIKNKDIEVSNIPYDLLKSNNKPITEEEITKIFTLSFNFYDKEELTEVELLKTIKDYIDNHFSEEITLDLLSEKFNVNKFSCIRGFKNRYKLSPHAYLINSRINKSKELLLTKLPLSIIANECGFYDQSHFIKTFKDYTGVTPEKYK